MEKIRVVLADDHSILREGTTSVLAEYDDVEVVDAVSEGSNLLKIVESKEPDVLISDITMPGVSIFDVMEEIKQKGLNTKVLFLTMHDTSDYVFKALNSGVSGYITKYSAKGELINAIRSVARGEEYYSQEVTQLIVKGFKEKKNEGESAENPIDLLSTREKEVLKYLAEGMNSRQIAEELFLSERTVSNHRANMLQKCNVKNTIELVKLYYNSVNKW